ncbi:MAG: MogA/MoaB family molybdenum cofactor biosynthesis protein [Planctomycetota bacterium]
MSTGSPTDRHRAAAARDEPVARCAVLTVSDTRTPETDAGGRLVRDRLAAAGHAITDHAILPDDPARIADRLDAWLKKVDLDLVVTTGGTGIAARDTTVEVVRRRLTKEIEGFGELFRMLSYDAVGPAAMISRATGGLADNALLFCLPGSPNAVELALDKLILPELPHLLWESKR